MCNQKLWAGGGALLGVPLRGGDGVMSWIYQKSVNKAEGTANAKEPVGMNWIYQKKWRSLHFCPSYAVYGNVVPTSASGTVLTLFYIVCICWTSCKAQMIGICTAGGGELCQSWIRSLHKERNIAAQDSLVEEFHRWKEPGDFEISIECKKNQAAWACYFWFIPLICSQLSSSHSLCTVTVSFFASGSLTSVWADSVGCIVSWTPSVIFVLSVFSTAHRLASN